MRTWGRVGQIGGQGGTWTLVQTDVNGDNSNVYLTALVQVLRLNLLESPFWANYGIPAYPSVTSQVFPDFYATATQTQFAPFFASLTIIRVQGSFPPVYNVRALCYSGAILTAQVAT